MSFTFELYLGDGSKVGDYTTIVPGPWRPGDLLYDGGAAAWRIKSVITAEDYEYSGDVSGCWLVERVE